MFCGAALDTAWDVRCKDLTGAVDTLKTISSQDALTLLKSSFSAPRVLHLLRCSPSVDHPSLNKFDDLLKDSVQHITNSDLSDNKWIQASLPVRDGGLGIQADILAGCTALDSKFLHVYLMCRKYCRQNSPSGIVQQCWLIRRAIVEGSLNSPYSRASFLAACHQHSGDWLFALPIASCG